MNIPEERYRALAEETDTLIGHLQDCIENHALGEMAGWSHVAELQYLNGRLRELVVFMHDEVEDD